MTTIFNTPSNWRFHIVMFLIITSVPFLASDSDCLTVFFLSKLVGITLAIVAVILLRHWDSHGLLNDIKNNTKE